MKARVLSVPALGELVLLYRLGEETERGKAVRAVLAELQLPVKTVTEDMLPQPVGWCAEIPGVPPAAEPAQEDAFPEEAMVLRGFSRKRMDELLGALKQRSLSVSLKAVVTAHNMNWPFQSLLQELTREREAIRIQLKGKHS